MDPKTAAEKLYESGMKDRAIAAEVKTSAMTINRIRNGEHALKEWNLGQRLIRLAEERKPRVKRNGT